MVDEGGPQSGKRTFIVVYDKVLGCRWYNTQTGQIGGQLGATGYSSVPTGFLIKHAAISGNGRYVKIGENQVGFYIWDVATLSVSACANHKGMLCSGYGILGNDAYVNAAGVIDEINTLIRPLDNLADFTPLISPLPSPHHFGQEQHYVWTNGNFDSTLPVCASLYDYEGDTDIDAPYDGEILCIETDGLASTVWRFAHNRAVWTEPYFNTQPLGNMTADGRYFLFTSGWDAQLRNNRSGQPRSDVWIVKLD